MKKIELSGIIEFVKASWKWEKIKLTQPDGYKIDLVSRFAEAVDNYPGVKVQVNYWISDKPCTKSEMTEGVLRKLVGAIESEYTSYDFQYSSWTSDTAYETGLTVGGHDLFTELKQSDGKYLIIELNFSE